MDAEGRALCSLRQPAEMNGEGAFVTVGVGRIIETIVDDSIERATAVFATTCWVTHFL
jgi:hypothetical protein